MLPNIWRPIAIGLMTFILGAGMTWVNEESQRDVIAADYRAIKEQIVSLQVEQARLEEKVDLLLQQVAKH